MSNTPNLSLPLLAEAQASPDIPINDGRYIVDVLLQGRVLEQGVTSPPGGEAEGDAYIVGTAGLTGVFVGHANDVAAFQGGGYRFYSPKVGWRIFVIYDNDFVQFDGGSPGEWFTGSSTFTVSTPGSPSFDSSDVRELQFVNADVEEVSPGVVRITPGTGPGTGGPIELQVALSDMTTDLTIGASKGYIRAPCGFEIDEVRSSLFDASSSGLVTVDINKNGGTILSTKLSIDATEKTSRTAAAPVVVSDDSVNDDDELTFDIDAAGTDAKGLIVTIVGTRT